MPTPTRAAGDCGGREGCGSMRTPKEGGRWGDGREGPASRSAREEACDQRSEPQDVTSSWGRRAGINLQPEVEPHQTERSPRDSSIEDNSRPVAGSEMNIQAVRGR